MRRPNSSCWDLRKDYQKYKPRNKPLVAKLRATRNTKPILPNAISPKKANLIHMSRVLEAIFDIFDNLTFRTLYHITLQIKLVLHQNLVWQQ